MPEIKDQIGSLYALEEHASGTTCVHARHPLAKLLGTLVFIVCVVSFERHALVRLAPYLLYPAILIALSGVPLWLVLKRALVALPFCALVGLSNLFYGPSGALSFATLLVRALLCVSAAVLLMAVTPFADLTGALRQLHMPPLLIALFEMTYRYIGALLEEAASMLTAYRLRSLGKSRLEMRHMGSFVGQLLLRSIDRAERIHAAMRCRGYTLQGFPTKRRPLDAGDCLYIALSSGFPILFRLWRIL